MVYKQGYLGKFRYLKSDLMKLQNLDHGILKKIVSFLDPESRVNFLKTSKNFYQEPAKERAKLYCFLCYWSIWFHDISLGNTVGGGEDFSHIMRNEFLGKEYKWGADGKPYKLKHFRRRHYSSDRDERELNFIHLYFGKLILFGIKLIIKLCKNK